MAAPQFMSRSPSLLVRLRAAVIVFGLLNALEQTAAQNFDFFYFVQQWPGSFCGTSRSCCYPTTGKPAAEFSIHGLWPNNNDGSYPSFCDQSNSFNPSLIIDLRSQLQVLWETLACPSADGEQFWAHEWEKHGTCSESLLDEHGYFQAALNLRQNIDILGAFQRAGIQPDGNSYSLRAMEDALTQALGQTPGMECNVDATGNEQLYQVYVCVGTDASTIIECPVYPRATCPSQVVFPSF